MVSFGGKMENFIMDNGNMIKEMDQEQKYGLQEINMKDFGEMINDMVKDH